MSQSNNNFKTSYDSLKKKYDSVLTELETLKDEHASLEAELNKLKNDYSENTVIQSMNDMKERYNELMRTTVSIYKYKDMEHKYYKLYRCTYSMLTLIDHVKKLVNEVDSKIIYDRNNTLDRAKNDLLTMHDIIEDVIEES